MSRNPFRSLIGADLAALKIERSLRPRTCGDRPFAEGSPLDRSGVQLKDVLAVGGACPLRGRRLTGRAAADFCCPRIGRFAAVGDGGWWQDAVVYQV